MATVKSSVALPWLMSIIIILWLDPTQIAADDTNAGCQILPDNNIMIDIPEEQEIGTIVANLTIIPSFSDVSFSCDSSVGVEFCDYIGLDNSIQGFPNLVIKKKIDIESDDLQQSLSDGALIGRPGHIYYSFNPGQIVAVTCTEPGTLPLSRLIQPVYINNVNEPMEMADSFVTTVAELALANTSLVFNEDLITYDFDDNLDLDPDRTVFDCTILEEDAPFFVSECKTEFHETTSFATNIAKLQVKPPPPTLDYETQNFYNITLQVTDSPDYYGTVNAVQTSLFIRIADLDDQDPLFGHSPYYASVDEDIFTGRLSIKPDEIDAVDQDTLNAEIAYEFVVDELTPACQVHLEIDETTGLVFVISPFDREIDAQCEVTVKAYQKYNVARFSTVDLVVSINDRNDNCPTFEMPTYEGIITIEDLYVMNNDATRERMLITVTDADVALEFQGVLTYDYGDADMFQVTDETIPGTNSKQIYVKLERPEMLDISRPYAIQVSVTDNSQTCEGGKIYTTRINIQPVDLRPIFDQPAYFANIPEESKWGELVTTVTARTYDNQGGITYLLDQATNGGELVFELNNENGEIRVISEQTDALKIPEYVLIIEAGDRRSQPVRSASVTCTIFINDTNNQCPEFNKDAYFGEISASDLYAVESGTLNQLMLIATDNDTKIDYTNVYISSGNVNNIFGLDESDTFIPQTDQWAIKLLEPLLLQDGETYDLTVTLEDRNNNNLCEAQTVDVTITAADLSPVFDFNEYITDMDELSPIGTPVLQVHARRYDNNPGDIYYSLKSGNNQGLAFFTIDRQTGWITVIDGTTDADKNVKEFTLLVIAEDRATQPPRTASATVIIALNNINDNCPEFGMTQYTGTVTPQDKYVVRDDGSLDRLVLTTVDADKVYSGSIQQLPGSTDVFGIETSLVSDGSATEVYVTLIDPTKLGLDFYTVLILVTDPNTVPIVPACDDFIANVSVVITADLSPIFDAPPGGYRGFLEENSLVGTFIIKITATSYDGSPGIIKYLLKESQGLFQIDYDTGDITTISADVDYENIQEYTLVVEAQDRSTEPFRTASATVIISITNTNDNCPQFINPPTNGQISLQDLYVTDTDTLERLILVATDNDPTFIGDIELLTGPGTNVFVLDEDRTITGQSRVSIRLLDDDLLTDNSYPLQILASDASSVLPSGCSGTPINVLVDVVGDFAPIFTLPEYFGSVDERAVSGTFVVQVEATSQGSKPDIVYIIKSVSNNGATFFVIDRVSGIITLGTSNIDYEDVREFLIVVEAQDRGTEPFRSSSTTVIVTVININDNCPMFDQEELIGTVTPQDKYVVRNDGSLNRLVLTTVDADMVFSGFIQQLTSTDIFGIETNLISDGSATEVYVTLDDPSKLGLDFYSVLISITDTNTVPTVPACDPFVGNVSVVITADLSPVFVMPPGGYRGYLEENSPGGTWVITIIATSYDGKPGNIRYQLKDGKNLFQIDVVTGDITTISADSDFESIQEYTLVVEAQDRSTEPFRTSSATVIISVNNTNDICPDFIDPPSSGQISLQDLYVTDKDTLDRLLLVAIDGDMNFMGDVELLSGPGTGVFALDEDRTITGQSRVFIRLLDDDLLTQDSYALQIRSSDSSVLPSGCVSAPIDVLVEVVSDLAPNFTLPEYSANIIEASPIDTFVVQVEATSQSSKPDIVYIIKSVSNNGVSFFTIDRVTGVILLTSPDTDYETRTQYTIVVEAQDRGVEPFRSATTTVFVYLGDANDNCPVFRQSTYTGEITARDLYVVTGSGSTERLVLTADDGDTAFMGSFQLESGPGDGIFTIVTNVVPDETERDVWIQLVDPLLLVDSSYVLQITTTDFCGRSGSDTTTVTINVVEDLAPKFDKDEYTGSVEEGANIGFVVVQVNATSQNVGTNEILYTIKTGSNNGLNYFDIDANTGIITVISIDIDYESNAEFTLVIEAQDRGTEPPRSATTVVIISITDRNDMCPGFDADNYFGQITTEDVYVVQQGGVEYLVLRASDGDTFFTGTARLESDSSGGSFGIEPVSPSEIRIILVDKSGIQDGITYFVQVSMTDSSIGCLSDRTNVAIEVLDLSPKFTQSEYPGSVDEGSLDNTFVVQVIALNKDGDSQGIVYQLTWATGDGLTHFWIDSEGRIYARDTINADITSEYTLSVVAQDVRFEPPRSASATVIITIGDINDLCPTFDSASYMGSMGPGDAFVLDMVGTERLRLIGVDNDVTGFIGAASIESDTSNGGFALESTPTAGQWYIQVAVPSLVELGEYTLTVSVVDTSSDGGKSCVEDLTEVTITVTDALIPKFEKDLYEGDVPENSPPGTEIIQVNATNKDGNNDGIIYIIRSGSNQGLNYFDINPLTGVITVKPGVEIDRELYAEFVLFIEATDTRLEPQRTGGTTVSIVVGDINDQCPTFTTSFFVGSMSIEDNYVLQSDGTDRLVLTAVDLDVDFIGVADIQTDSTGGGFILVQTADPDKWNVKVDDASRIVLGVHTLMVSVTDNTAVRPCGQDLSEVTIAVTDDLTPKFDQDPYMGSVEEGANLGFPVIQVSATNKDGNNLGIVYRIKSGSNNGINFFEINPNTGVISVRNGNIDAELVLEFILFVEATDTRLDPQRSGITTVVISVQDANDQCPSFTNDIYTGTLQQGESYVLGTDGRLMLSALDGDQMFTGTVTIDSDSSGDLFELVEVPETTDKNIRDFYLITTDTAIGIDVYTIEISVRDGSSIADPPCTVNRTSVTVSVTESGQVPPSFTDDTYRGDVSEGAPTNAFIVKVTALNDEGTSDNMLYLLKSVSNGGDNLFTVDPDDGEVRVGSPIIDRELVSEYTLFIEAQDIRTTPVLSDTTTVIVTILDVNDNPPVFQLPSWGSYNATLTEDARVGFVVITVTAIDNDESSDTTYFITTPGVPFAIVDPSVGAITISGPLNTDPPDGIGSYTIQIIAWDADGIQNDEASLIITVTDVNDNGPVFGQDPYELSVEENDNTPVSITVSASDIDTGDGGIVRYFLQSPLDKNIVVDPNTGRVTFNGPYDREAESQIIAIIVATDNGEPALSDTAQVILTITDVNDQAPVFAQNGCEGEVLIPEDLQLNAMVCQVLATDGDEEGTGAALISYSLTGFDSDFFIIEKDVEGFGVIRLNKEVDRETKDLYQITVVASDQGSPPLSVNLLVTIRVTDVNDEPPEFTSQTEYRKSYTDEVPSGTQVISVTATDRDLDPFKTVLCNITSSDGSDSFFFVNSDGAVCTISTQMTVPVRQAGSYVIFVQAYNPDRPDLAGNSIATVTIRVTRDSCFVVIDPTDYYAKAEVGNINAGQEVVRVMATSPCGTDGLEYSITKQTLTPTPLDPPSDSLQLTIDTVTGSVSSVTNNPDFGTHNVEVMAFNSSNPDSSTDLGYVTIVVIPNINNPPSFDSASYSKLVQAPKLSGDVIINLEYNVTDPDYPATGVGELMLTELSETKDTGEATNFFQISAKGEVTLVNNLLEVPEALTINMVVQVEDSGLPPLTDTATIILSIEPSASNPPVFIDQCGGTQFVDENEPNPYFLCQVTAEGSSSISYSVDDSINFRVSVDGSIYTNKVFDYENTAERLFKVLVTARSTSDGLTATTSVNVEVRDENDGEPQFDQTAYEFSILEDVASGGCAGKFVGTVHATDPDTNPDYAFIQYRIAGEAYDFTIDATSGSIETTSCIDRETTEYQSGVVNIVVVAANTRATPILDAEATVQIMIGDQNDNDPVFQQDRYTLLLPDLPPSTELITVRADDIDQGKNAELYYVIAQDQKGFIYEYFTVNRLTGVVSTTPTAELPPNEGLEATIIIEAWDNGSPPRNDETEVIVTVTPGPLDVPIFLEDDRQQVLNFTENKQPLGECYSFIPPLYDESLVLVYSIVNDTSGGQVGLQCNLEAVLCNMVSLDREDGDSYVLVIEANTCDPSVFDCGSCGSGNDEPARVSRDVDQTAEVEPVAVASNQMVMSVTVLDINDEKPVTYGFIDGLPHKYWIGIADNVAYNSTVFNIDATDADLNSLLVYELSIYQEPSTQNIQCPDLPLIKLNNEGNLLSRDAVYSYLVVEDTNIRIEQLSCEYVVTVTDENTDPDYPLMRSVSIPTKIKALYSFEHAIIIMDSPPEMIVGEAEQLARCFSQGMNDYILRMEFVRAKYLDEKNGFTIVDSQRTDLWVYAVNDLTGEFAKYWDIKEAWDANPFKDVCGVSLFAGEPPVMRPAHVRRDYLYPYASYVGWAVLALACFITLAALLCIYILYDSWDKLVVERTKFMSAVMTGTVNIGYRHEKQAQYVDAGVVTDAWEWDQPMPLEKAKQFESQEVILDFFSEYYNDAMLSDEALLSVIREKSSPSEVTVIVDHGELEHAGNDLFSISRETSSSYDEDGKAIVAVGRGKGSFKTAAEKGYGFQVDTRGSKKDYQKQVSVTKETTTSYEVVDVPVGADGKARIGRVEGSLQRTDKDTRVIQAASYGSKKTSEDRYNGVEVARGEATRSQIGKTQNVEIYEKKATELREVAGREMTRSQVGKTQNVEIYEKKAAEREVARGEMTRSQVGKTKKVEIYETKSPEREVKTTSQGSKVIIIAKDRGEDKTQKTEKDKQVTKAASFGGWAKTSEKASYNNYKDVTRGETTTSQGGRTQTVEMVSYETRAPESSVKTTTTQGSKVIRIEKDRDEYSPQKTDKDRRVIKTASFGGKVQTVEEKASYDRYRSVDVTRGEDGTRVIKKETPLSKIKTVEVSVEKDTTEPASPVKGLISKFSSGGSSITATSQSTASSQLSDADRKQLQQMQFQIVTKEESKPSVTAVTKFSKESKFETKVDGGKRDVAASVLVSSKGSKKETKVEGGKRQVVIQETSQPSATVVVTSKGSTKERKVEGGKREVVIQETSQPSAKVVITSKGSKKGSKKGNKVEGGKRQVVIQETSQPSATVVITSKGSKKGSKKETKFEGGRKGVVVHKETQELQGVLESSKPPGSLLLTSKGSKKETKVEGGQREIAFQAQPQQFQVQGGRREVVIHKESTELPREFQVVTHQTSRPSGASIVRSQSRESKVETKFEGGKGQTSIHEQSKQLHVEGGKRELVVLEQSGQLPAAGFQVALYEGSQPSGTTITRSQSSRESKSKVETKFEGGSRQVTSYEQSRREEMTMSQTTATVFETNLEGVDVGDLLAIQANVEKKRKSSKKNAKPST